MACDFGMAFFETSAKTNQNVYEVFIYLANEILKANKGKYQKNIIKLDKKMINK